MLEGGEAGGKGREENEKSEYKEILVRRDFPRGVSRHILNSGIPESHFRYTLMDDSGIEEPRDRSIAFIRKCRMKTASGGISIRFFGVGKDLGKSGGCATLPVLEE